jgi:hypothetical protein
MTRNPHVWLNIGITAGDEFVDVARQWRPFRMWASVLLVWCHGFSPEARALGVSSSV